MAMVTPLSALDQPAVPPVPAGAEVLDVSRYSQSDIAVDVADGKTVDVPLSDPHYQLKVSLHHEIL